jgi:arylformamidase
MILSMQMEKNNWIDVTVTLRTGMVHWPGDIEVEFTKRMSMDKGSDANVTEISASAHTGTHIDAPLHFIKNGKDISSLSLDRMIGEVLVVRIKNKSVVPLDEVSALDINEGDRIIFLTANSDEDWSMQPFRTGYIYLSTDAAKYLVSKKIRTVGIDYLSIAGEENGAEVHRLLLENEILIIEGLNLRNIEPGKYQMICLPLKIEGADGAPARVLLSKQ